MLLAIADANYKFIYIDTGAFGKDSDSSIFERTDFYKKLENNELDIPKGQPLPGTVGPNMTYTVISDEAFPLCQNVIRHYSGNVLSHKKRFSTTDCLGSAGITVQLAYYQINGKFSKKAINVNLDFAKILIKTCWALHSFVRSTDGFNIQDALSVQEFIAMGQDTSGLSRASIQSTQARNKLTELFYFRCWQRPLANKL